MEHQIYNDKARNKNWVGISTTLKQYPQYFAEQVVDFACKDQKALVIIADDIAAITIQALGQSRTRAKKIAKTKGDEYYDLYSRIAGDRAKVVRWADVNGEREEKIYDILRMQYEVDPVFRECVRQPIRAYMQGRPHTLTEKRLEAMSEYILRELPFLLDGVNFAGVRYDRLIYPTYKNTSLSKLSEAIQNGTRFPKIKEQLGLSGDHTLVEFLLE